MCRYIHIYICILCGYSSLYGVVLSSTIMCNQFTICQIILHLVGIFVFLVWPSDDQRQLPSTEWKSCRPFQWWPAQPGRALEVAWRVGCLCLFFSNSTNIQKHCYGWVCPIHKKKKRRRNIQHHPTTIKKIATARDITGSRICSTALATFAPTGTGMD